VRITDDEYPLKAVLRVVAERNALAATLADCEAISEEIRKQNNGLLIQVQDQREEIIRVNDAHGKTQVECNALRAEVAALQERLRASVARGDFAQMEVERLRADISEELNESPPTPKQHPVKVGDWVRRTKLPGDQSPVGIVKQVTAINCDGERYHFADGDFWSVDNCEPCAHQHPAQDGQWVRRTVASGTEPVGTMIQVQRSRTLHSEYVTRGAQVVPWAHCEPCDPPIAGHDTPAGKEAAEAVIRDSQMTEIKVGDVVEVFQASGNMTFKADIGAGGIVKSIVPASKELHAHAMIESNGNLRLPAGRSVSLCDVRKVTQ